MDRDIRVLRLLALAATILTPAVGAAQTPPKGNAPIPPKSEQLDPNACGHATVGQGGDHDMRKPAGKDLSEQLAQSGGVICPPDEVDPAIKAPTPPAGSMPVIPPPGGPGGDPDVQPR